MSNSPATIYPTSASLGVARCSVCGLLSGALTPGSVCRRCGTRLEVRKPNSLSRSWAYLIAAGILYIPANLYPVLQSRTVQGNESNTIMQGVVHLWQQGSWPLAALVFFASIVVPLLKFLAMTLLLSSVHTQSNSHLHERARLFRLLELVGRWSMLDVYVVATLVALVQLRSLATIEPGPGALAFGAVVVLSMLAAQSFDPRLLWDAAGQNVRH